MQTLLITCAIGCQAEGRRGKAEGGGAVVQQLLLMLEKLLLSLHNRNCVRDQSETNKIFQLSIQQFAREKCSNGRGD